MGYVYSKLRNVTEDQYDILKYHLPKWMRSTPGCTKKLLHIPINSLTLAGCPWVFRH